MPEARSPWMMEPSVSVAKYMKAPVKLARKFDSSEFAAHGPFDPAIGNDAGNGRVAVSGAEQESGRDDTCGQQGHDLFGEPPGGQCPFPVFGIASVIEQDDREGGDGYNHRYERHQSGVGDEPVGQQGGGQREQGAERDPCGAQTENAHERPAQQQGEGTGDVPFSGEDGAPETRIGG